MGHRNSRRTFWSENIYLYYLYHSFDQNDMLKNKNYIAAVLETPVAEIIS